MAPPVQADLPRAHRSRCTLRHSADRFHQPGAGHCVLTKARVDRLKTVHGLAEAQLPTVAVPALEVKNGNGAIDVSKIGATPCSCKLTPIKLLWPGTVIGTCILPLPSVPQRSTFMLTKGST